MTGGERLKADGTTLLTAMQWLGGLVFVAFCLYETYRTGSDIISRRTSESWKSLAGALQGQVDSHAVQLFEAKEHNSSLARMNAELMSLNLSLQNTNQQQQSTITEQTRRISEQQGHITGLEERVRQMEAELSLMRTAPRAVIAA
jgi:chromosome segregation ATPase